MSKYRHYSTFPDERNFHLYIVEWKSNAIFVCRGDPDKLSECRLQSIALISSNWQSFISIRHSSVVKALACCSEGGRFDSWSALGTFLLTDTFRNSYYGMLGPPGSMNIISDNAGADEHYSEITFIDPRIQPIIRRYRPNTPPKAEISYIFFIILKDCAVRKGGIMNLLRNHKLIYNNWGGIEWES